jgi:hypothetical protein
LEVRGVMHLEKTLAPWPMHRPAAATPAAA